jgi:uncharacterized surface protein with fasciclin (FAS1) repeats
MTRILASLAALAVAAAPLAALAQPAAAPAAPATAAPAAPAAPAPAAAAPAAQAPAASGIPTIAPSGDLVSTLTAAGKYSILLKALDANGLTPVLQSAGPLTIVAPTDAAFNALPPGTVENLMKPENSAQLRALLLNHIVNAAVTSANIQGSTPVDIPNVGNGKLKFDATTPAVKVDGANVIAEGQASNGYIYAVDKVLQPAA